MNDINSLSHSKWRYQYHIVYAPKYRRKEVYGKIKSDIGQILRKLCEQKSVEIIEAEACPDHNHMLVSIPPSLSVAQFMGFLKGKSSLMIFDRHGKLEVQVWERESVFGLALALRARRNGDMPTYERILGQVSAKSVKHGQFT